MKSQIEEIISALWLIAGLLAISIGWTIFGWVLIVKAATDSVAAIYYACQEISRQTKEARKLEGQRL